MISEACEEAFREIRADLYPSIFWLTAESRPCWACWTVCPPLLHVLLVRIEQIECLRSVGRTGAGSGASERSRATNGARAGSCDMMKAASARERSMGSLPAPRRLPPARGVIQGGQPSLDVQHWLA